ncbi:TPA: hypothetical protein ACPVZG_000020 [Vibrio parahaemolyticus]
MTKKPLLYSFKEKAYQYSQFLDNIGNGSPNNNVGRTETLGAGSKYQPLTKTTIKDHFNNYTTHKNPTAYILKNQLMNLAGFAICVYSIWWYMSLLQTKEQILNPVEILSTQGNTITAIFTALIAPLMMAVGTFAHFDMKVWSGGKSNISNDETLGQANMYERAGFLALILNLYAGGLSGSVMLNLYVIDYSIFGIAGFISSWIVALYFFSVVSRRIKLSIAEYAAK